MEGFAALERTMRRRTGSGLSPLPPPLVSQVGARARVFEGVHPLHYPSELPLPVIRWEPGGSAQGRF